MGCGGAASRVFEFPLQRASSLAQTLYCGRQSIYPGGQGLAELGYLRIWEAPSVAALGRTPKEFLEPPAGLSWLVTPGRDGETRSALEVGDGA